MYNKEEANYTGYKIFPYNSNITILNIVRYKSRCTIYRDPPTKVFHQVKASISQCVLDILWMLYSWKFTRMSMMYILLLIYSCLMTFLMATISHAGYTPKKKIYRIETTYVRGQKQSVSAREQCYKLIIFLPWFSLCGINTSLVLFADGPWWTETDQPD